MRYYHTTGEWIDVVKAKTWEWQCGTREFSHSGGFRDTKDEAVLSAMSYVKGYWNITDINKIRKIEEIIRM